MFLERTDSRRDDVERRRSDERRDAERYQHVRITCATVAALLDRAFGQLARAAALFAWPGSHAARSRQMAARFAAGARPGRYGMREVLGLTGTGG